MDKQNLALIEDLMTEFRTLKAKVKSGLPMIEAEGRRMDDLLDSLEANGALEQATDELNARRHRAIRPDVASGYQPRGKVFDSFGSQLQAIHAAAQPGTEPDRKLFQVRAATGMSEGIPSDGGSIEAPYTSDRIRNNPQIQGSLNYATA